MAKGLLIIMEWASGLMVSERSPLGRVAVQKREERKVMSVLLTLKFKDVEDQK